jgi:hypothetical protein
MSWTRSAIKHITLSFTSYLLAHNCRAAAC